MTIRKRSLGSPTRHRRASKQPLALQRCTGSPLKNTRSSLRTSKRDIDPKDDDLKYSLWFDVLYPDWKNGEYLFWAVDDLALRFDQLLE